MTAIEHHHLFDFEPPTPPRTPEEAYQRIAELEAVMGVAPGWMAEARMWGAQLEADVAFARERVAALDRLSDSLLESSKRWRAGVEERLASVERRCDSITEIAFELTERVNELADDADEWQLWRRRLLQATEQYGDVIGRIPRPADAQEARAGGT